MKIKRFIQVGLFVVVFAVLFGLGRVFASEPGGGKDDEGKLDIIEKVVDHDYVDFYFLGKLPLPQFPKVHIGGMTIDFSITKSLFMMFFRRGFCFWC